MSKLKHLSFLLMVLSLASCKPDIDYGLHSKLFPFVDSLKVSKGSSYLLIKRYSGNKINVSDTGIILQNITGDSLVSFSNKQSNLTLRRCRFNKIEIGSDWNNSPVLNLDFASLGHDSAYFINRYPTGQLRIFSKTIGYIRPANVKFLAVYNSFVDNSSFISCSEVDTIKLSNLKFASDSTQLSLGRMLKSTISSIGVINPTSELIEHKTILILDGMDASKLNIDYRFFKYEPTGDDDNYLGIIQNFHSLIHSERIHGSQEAVLSASIDSCIYEDRRRYITYLLPVVKLWWNNYGYDKPQVIISAMEVFAAITIINLLFFRKLLSSYPFTEVSHELTARSHKGILIKSLNKLSLCFIYTGYVFWGLKFDIKSLKLHSKSIAFWIILQYAIGIVCLAYIANLIITR